MLCRRRVLHLMLATGGLFGASLGAPSNEVSSAGAAGPPLITTSLIRVAFSSPSQGVGLFQTERARRDGAGRVSCTLYTRPTGNGGVSFGARGAVLAHTNCANGAAFSTLGFDKGGVLFAYGPGLRVSANRGRTWSTALLPGGTAALAGTGASTWALTTSCHAGAQSCRLTLSCTTDGGRSWTRAPEQPPDHTISSFAALGAEHGSSSLMAAAPDGTLMLALPERPVSATGPIPPRVLVERLNPRAGTWQVTKVSCASGGFGAELSVAPDGSAWLACGSEPGAGAQVKSLARTPGNGMDWHTIVAACVPGPGCHDTMPLSGYLDGLYALNSQTAFYIGDRSSLTATFNGGRSWRTWPRIGGSDAGTTEVTFVNQTDGWAIAQAPFSGGAALWVTHDGGREWARS